MRRTLLSRLTAILLTILMLLTTIPTALGASEMDAAFAGTSSAQVVQDTLYAVTNGCILATAQGEAAPTVYIDLTAYPDMTPEWLLLTSDGHTLYALDTGTGSLYTAANGELTPMLQLNAAMASGATLSFFMLARPVIRCGFLYALYTAPTDYTKSLYRFSLSDGKGEARLTQHPSLSELLPYKEDQLLAVDADTMALLILDARDGSLAGEDGALPSYDDGALAYDAAEDRLICLSGTEVRVLRGSSSETVDFSPIDGAYCVRYAGLWGSRYVLLSDTGLLYTCDTIPGAAIADALTLWYEPNTFPDTQLITQFTLANPDVPIITRGGDSTLTALTTAAVSGDASVDIYLLSTNLIDSIEVFSHGYAMALDDAALQADVDAMYPQVKAALTMDGVLYGYPVALNLDYFTVCPELLAATDLGSVPTTISEYLDLLLRWYELGLSADPSMTFDGSDTVSAQWQSTIGLLLSRYLQENRTADAPVTFDTPDFRAAMTKLATLAPWKALPATADQDAQSPFADTFVSPFMQVYNAEKQGAEYLLPPVFSADADPQVNGALMYLVVNPASRHKAEALRFLDYLRENMDCITRCMLCPAEDQPVEKVNAADDVQACQDEVDRIQRSITELEAQDAQRTTQGLSAVHAAELSTLQDMLTQAEAALAYQQEHRWLYTAETIAAYRRIAGSMSFDQSAALLDLYDDLDAETILMRFLEGGMSLDQALSELDRRAAMMFYEN